jgi:hypothetical protein
VISWGGGVPTDSGLSGIFADDEGREVGQAVLAAEAGEGFEKLAAELAAVERRPDTAGDLGVGQRAT